MNQHEAIVLEIHAAVDALGGADSITTQSVAEAVQAKYGTEGVSPYIAYASLEHFKQMARQVLALKFDVAAKELGEATGELFDDRLQERYPVPAPRGEERVYKRLEALTDIEVAWNVQRLERAGRSLIAHARTLRAWHQSRKPAAA